MPWELCLVQGTSLEAYLQLTSKVNRIFPVAQSKGSQNPFFVSDSERTISLNCIFNIDLTVGCYHLYVFKIFLFIHRVSSSIIAGIMNEHGRFSSLILKYVPDSYWFYQEGGKQIQ